MKYKCPYCKSIFKGKPRARCSFCGKYMQIPVNLSDIPPEEKKRIKEKIRAEAEIQRRMITMFNFAPGRNPFVTTGIIIVLLIVGSLLSSRTMVVVKGDTKKRSPEMKAMEELFALRVAVERFKRDCGKYPTQEENLKALVKNPGLVNWKGPYVNIIKPDPWRIKYVYQVKSNSVDIFSCGPDKKAGTSDDILSCTPSEDEVNNDLDNLEEEEDNEYVIPNALPPVRIGR